MQRSVALSAATRGRRAAYRVDFSRSLRICRTRV
jgi:hypothetical protein